jgi:Mg2+ and Co2+ transporter CorA
MVKWRLQEFDQEMLAYLSKANELGPYSVDVHILFTRLGISFHDAKHPIYADIEDSVHERIGLGLRNSDSRTFILAFIESTDSLIDVCRWMKGKDDHTASQHLNCP